MTNRARVAAATADPVAANDRDAVTTTIAAAADLSVTKTGPATATAGTAISWTVQATNAGPSDAVSLVVTDTLPAGTTYVSDDASGAFQQQRACQSAGAGTDHLHDPGLPGIPDVERFRAAAIAILADQVAHHLDRALVLGEPLAEGKGIRLVGQTPLEHLPAPESNFSAESLAIYDEIRAEQTKILMRDAKGSSSVYG